MPELPEMRALSERLDALVGMSRLTSVDLPGFWGLKTVAPGPAELVGATLAHVTSQGKFVAFEFATQGRILVHLGNAGRLDVERPAKRTRPRGSLARLGFGEPAVLVREHGTERRAGIWFLGQGDDGPLATLGPEPFEERFAEHVLRAEDRRHLHTMLRDQRTVAGIGRGYADDALHRAGMSPFASLSGLDEAGRTLLLKSVRDVLDEALSRERSRTGGLSGNSLGERFEIHRKAGTPCPRCGRRLERVSFSSHEIAYCPDCQTNGKVLADRRTSRLLR